MQQEMTRAVDSVPGFRGDGSIGRIVSVTGAKAIVLLDGAQDRPNNQVSDRPEMGTLLAIDTENTVVLAIVSALSVPVPSQREGEAEIWIAELGLVGELWKNEEGVPSAFNRGVTVYPALGDRVRVSGKSELRLAFCGLNEDGVRVGTLRQDPTIPAMVRVDDLLGKHFAILGTTGTGKSCTTALILRSILEQHPAAHIVLLDPHNEYATAFTEFAEVVSPRNMQLPYWLLNFEEIVEVLIGDSNRKAEIEVLQELIPIAKGRYSAGRNGENTKLRRAAMDSSRFTVDTPVPYRISDLTSLIDERMGKLENKRDLAPYRNLKTRIDTISQDGRYAFMFGSLTVYDGMAQVLSRIFRVPVNNKPITILELTGLPTEIVNVVVSVLCRMTFDFALWSEGKVPVTLVCEEAHRYVPANSSLGFEPCKRAIAKIAKEGRKYGASLCIVTQRPAEIDPTILSQCNTVFALRMSNDKDQQIVQSAVSDTGSGLLEFLPALGQREAIAFGDGVSLPVRIKFDELAKSSLPRSSTARFSECWQTSVGDEGFLEQVVERWRTAGGSAIGDANSTTAMLADSLGIPDQGTVPGEEHMLAAPAGEMAEMNVGQRHALQAEELQGLQPSPGFPQPDGEPRPLRRTPLRSSTDRGPTAAPAAERPSLRRKPLTDTGAAPAASVPSGDPDSGSALKSLRDKLRQRTQR
ncbi:MAG: DUF87 domain-containing protein [Pseudomonadota bacterium]